MSTPNEPQDPYAAGNQPGAGGQPPQQPGQPPQYGAPQPPQYGAPQAPQYGAPQYGAPQYGAPQAPQYDPNQYGGGAPGYGLNPYPKNGLGVWSLVLGILSYVLCGIFAAIAAIIVGGRAKQAVAAGEANNGGMATAGVVLGWINVILSVISFIFLAIWFANGGWDQFQQDFQDGMNSTTY